MGPGRENTATNPTMIVLCAETQGSPLMFTFPTKFRGLSEGLHQTEEVFRESWPGTGTGKGDMDAGGGKDH